jgi:hypothetical protein
MTMTRAGYDLLVDALSEARDLARREVQKQAEDAGIIYQARLDLDAAVKVTMNHVINEVCTALKIDNRHFNKERFVSALWTRLDKHTTDVVR